MRDMDAVILQENIEGLLNLVRMLLPGGGSAGCVYLDDLSALQRSIHKQINDLYSQRGKTPEQDATLCLGPSFRDIMCRCTPIRKTRIENGLSCSVL